MKNRALLFWLAVMLIFAGTVTIWAAWKKFGHPADDGHGLAGLDLGEEPLPPGPKLEDYTLTERSGRTMNSAELDGKVVVASFFFASCPQLCREQNIKISQLQQDFRDTDLRLVSITCDPENDTPSRLASYADFFNADPDMWFFLTGDYDYIRRVANDIYQVPLKRQTHSDRLIVVDRHGSLRGTYRATDPEEFAEIKTVLAKLLDEPVKTEPAVDAKKETEPETEEVDAATPKAQG